MWYPFIPNKSKTQSISAEISSMIFSPLRSYVFLKCSFNFLKIRPAYIQVHMQNAIAEFPLTLSY